MKIGLNPGSIVDASGAPLQGRVLVYVHDSLEKKLVYIMDGSDYVPTSNPVLLDTTGRIPTTLFFDVGVVDVLVQKYVGEPGHLADESPDEDFEDFDRFEAGFDFDPSTAGMQVVDTIADLKDIENPSGIVRVNCYTIPGDTFPRYYLWNPNCTASEDGGCVIADTHDASGMWCYLCEGDSIKSSVYGIKPGTDEANIGAFCGAPLAVSGDYVINYPTSLYFESGTYSQTTTSIVVSNNRTAVFSCGAKFTQATIYAYDVDVDGVCLNHDYIADFVIPQSQYENSATIRSSWCRSLDGFWRSNAKHLILDRSHLSNGVITSKIDISYAIIEGVYFTQTLQFLTGAYLNFDKCHFVGAKYIFHDDGYLKFTDCNFTDDLFWSINPSTIDFGTIAGGHHIEVNSWKITDSLNANVWMKWRITQGGGIVDLCGRHVYESVQGSKVSEFRNGMLTGTIETSVNVSFVDIGGSFHVYPASANKSLTVVRCNNVVIAVSTFSFQSIVAKDSDIVGTIDTSVTEYSHDGGGVHCTFKCAGWDADSGTHAKGNEVNIKNATLFLGNLSYFDNVRMQNCIVNYPVHIIPYASGGTLYLDAVFVGCSFGAQGFIEFTDSVTYNGDIHDVKIANLTIKDNLFYTGYSGLFPNGEGIAMPFMSQNATPYLGSLSESAATYKGNVGNCPRESLAMQAPTSVYDQTHVAFSGYTYMAAEFAVWNVSKNALFDFGAGIEFSTAGGDAMKVDPCCIHSEELGGANSQFAVHMALPTSQVQPNATVQLFDK